MYSRFAKVFYFLCVVLFIVAFLFIYASLPENVSYEGNAPHNQVSRNIFFLVALAAFGLLNLLTIVPAKLFENQAIPRFRDLFKLGDPYRDKILAWLYSFSGLLNFNLFIMTFYILRINSPDGMDMGGMQSLFYLIPLLLVIWVIALFILLGKKINQVRTMNFL